MTALILAATMALGARAQEAAPAPGPGAPMTAADLMRMDAAALDALFARLQPGPIPDGAAAGVASSNPGTGWGSFTQGFFGALWQGKTFDAANGRLINRTSVGNTADARVYQGPSRADGRAAIILDYARSGNPLARGVWDEIRMVRPGVYLGVAYLRFPPFLGPYRKWLYFALDFDARPAPPPRRDEPPQAP